MDRKRQFLKIRSFLEGLVRNVSEEDIGDQRFRDIRNLTQDILGRLTSFAGNANLNGVGGDQLLGDVIGAHPYFRSVEQTTPALAPQLIVFTEGNLTDGTTGRLYTCNILDASPVFTQIASPVAYAVDGQPVVAGEAPVNAARNRIVTMRQINNLLHIATGSGPIKIWDGTTFFASAGLAKPTVNPTATESALPIQVASATACPFSATGRLGVIRGLEQEIYGSNGVGSTAFFKINKLTDEVITQVTTPMVPALPLAPTTNGHVIVGGFDGNSVLFVNLRTNGGFRDLEVTKYDRANNTWGTAVVAVASLSSTTTLFDALIPSWNPSKLIVITSIGTTDSVTCYQLDANSFSPITSNNLALSAGGTATILRAVAADTNTNIIHMVYVKSTTPTITRYSQFTLSPVGGTNGHANTDIATYAMADGCQLIYMRDSNETYIRLIRHDGSLATSFYRDITQPFTGATAVGWALAGGNDVSSFRGPAICTGGNFYNDGSGPLDMAVYGRTNNPANPTTKSFFIMQNIESVREVANVKYDYGVSNANDSTESQVSNRVTIETQSGRPINLTFAVGSARAKYRRLFRTPNYRATGGTPALQRMKVNPSRELLSIVAGSPNTTINTRNNHNLAIGQMVSFENTGCTPSLNGQSLAVLNVVSPTSFTVAFATTVGSTIRGQMVVPDDQYQISNNTTTTYRDGNGGSIALIVFPFTPDTVWAPGSELSLGVPAISESYGPPVENATLIAISAQRMHLAGFPTNSVQGTTPSTVAFSLDTDYETFDLLSGSEEMQRNDGDVITALVEQDQDSLVIFKNNSIYVKNGDPTFQGAFRQVTSKIGCVAPRSAVVAEQLIMFLSKMGVAKFNGSFADHMGEPIDPITNALTDYQRSIASAVYFDQKYLLSVVNTDVNATRNSMVIEFNTIIGKWASIYDQAVHVWTPILNSINKLWYGPYSADFSGKFRRWAEGNYATSQIHKVETGRLDAGDQFIDKQWRRIWVLAKIPVGQVLTATWTVDKVRATGPLPISPTVWTGTGVQEAYLAQCPPSVMGKDLKLVITHTGSGQAEYEGYDIEYWTLPRRRGRIT